MSTNYYFKELSVENFRSFESLKIPKFRRINIIGGFNASGKTSLLETMFLCLDRRAAAAVIKPLLWRQQLQPQVQAQTQSLALDTLFNMPSDVGNRAELKFRHRDGSDKIVVEQGPMPASINLQFQAGADVASRMSLDSVSNPSGQGLNVSVFRDDEIEDAQFTAEAPGGAITTIYKLSNSPLAQGSIISRATRPAAVEMAAALSVVVKKGRKSELVKFMSLMVPGLSDLEILQDGQFTTIYGIIDGQRLQVTLLGDGFLNLLGAVLAVMNAKDGAVFFDEIDSAVHWSLLGKIWEKISNLARENNCQVFAASHSRECIFGAAAGIRAAGNSDDFQYIRLDRAKSQHLVTIYSMSEIEAAETSDLEIR